MKRIAICLASSAFVLAAPVAAQTTPPAPMTMPTKAVKEPGLRYFLVETITAKPGARLWTIISKHFIPAAKASGVPAPLVYHSETGPSQTMIITPLPGGTADLEWAVSPDDVKWMAALAKQEGSPEKAMALWKEYNDGIEKRTRELVHEHTQ